MIEQLKSAGDQLRAAWDNYLQVYSRIQGYSTREDGDHGLLSEITSQLDTELAFISSYKPKIQKIEINIRRARNYSLGVARKSSLPPELLTRIFHLARPQCGNLPELGEKNEMAPRCPDNIAQVCALWRKTAISDHWLWRHIDLSFVEEYYARFFNRAETYVARTGEVPIELHITADKSWAELVWEKDRLADLLSGISSRVEILELTATGGFPDFGRSIFRKVLLSEPRPLTKLVVNSGSDHRNTFIFSDSMPAPVTHSGCGHFTLDITKDQVENGFAPLTVLHLRGIFPVWASAAYHGLVDLRLLSSQDTSDLEASKLITILKSSPRLQILHFGLKFYSSNSRLVIEQAIPIDLQDLRVLKIFPCEDQEVTLRPNRVLRLLAPGSSPISLCLDGYHEPNTTLLADLEGFFERSRVRRFYTRATLPPIGALLSQAAHLESVVINGLESGSRDEMPSTWLESDKPGSSPQLGCMHITGSVLSEGDLRLLLDSCPKGISMHSCKVSRESGDETVYFSAQEVSEVFPIVRIVEDTLYSSEDPTVDWDILD